MTKTFEFTVILTGDGDTKAQAWEDAQNNFQEAYCKYIPDDFISYDSDSQIEGEEDGE